MKSGLYTSGLYDLTGVNFNIGTTVGYLNGMRVDEADLLETSSLLLDLIDTGIDDFFEFRIVPESERIIF